MKHGDWQEEAPCPVCGRVVGVYTPKGGDGSGQYPRRHKKTAGGWCPGSRVFVDWSNKTRTR